jgi:dihydrodipicolinate synthase/N-acetylneuraminate lyase
MSKLISAVWPAATELFDAELWLALALHAEHLTWAVGSGCDWVAVNGSLGEYEDGRSRSL